METSTKRTITIGKAYVSRGEQRHGAQIGRVEAMGPRIHGSSPAYALGNLIEVYPRLLGEHPIEITHSLSGYTVAAAGIRHKLTLDDVEAVAVGLFVIGYADLFGLEIVTVDQLPIAAETCGSCHGGHCTAH